MDHQTRRIDSFKNYEKRISYDHRREEPDSFNLGSSHLTVDQLHLSYDFKFFANGGYVYV